MKKQRAQNPTLHVYVITTSELSQICYVSHVLTIRNMFVQLLIRHLQVEAEANVHLYIQICLPSQVLSQPPLI